MQRMMDVSGTVQSASIWGAAQRTKRSCGHRMGLSGVRDSLTPVTGSMGSLESFRI